MHVIIWEFSVPTSRRHSFERDYGSEGPWVKLFRSAPGYLGTELLRDENDPERFITIDRWTSAAAFEAFKRDFGAAYEALDREFDGLSDRETKIGTFTPC